MSIDYSFDATLQQKFTSETVINLLQKGVQSLGFSYYDSYSHEALTSIEDLTTRFIDYYHKKIKYPPYILVDFDNGLFQLCIEANENDHIVVSIMTCATRWFIGDTCDIDADRYVAILKKLCSDYTILKIENDWF